MIKRIPYLLYIISGTIILWIGCLKYNDPYFWDEMGVYARGSLYMYDHGVSLFPSELPPELSRGHPLMVYSLTSLAYKLFGATVQVAHIFHLFVALGTLIANYFLATCFLKDRIYISLTVLLLSIQPPFVAQAGMVLPEMMLTFFLVLAIYFYLNKKYLWFGVLYSFAILTKETTVILLPCMYMYFVFQNKNNLFGDMKSILYLLIPSFVFCIFFLIQKMTHGWFFFPYHIDLVDMSIERFCDNYNSAISFFIYRQNRWTLSILLLLPFIFFLRKKINLDSKVVFVVSLFIVSIIFFIFNFFLYRYILYLFPFYVILVVKSIQYVIIDKRIIALYIAIVAVFIFCDSFRSYFYNDVNLHYRDVLHVQKEAINFLGDKGVTASVCGYFPFDRPLMDSRNGYKYSFSFSDIESAEYFLELKSGYNIPNNFKSNFEKIETFKFNGATSNIYKRIEKK